MGSILEKFFRRERRTIEQAVQVISVETSTESAERPQAAPVLYEGTATYGSDHYSINTVLYVKHIRNDEIINTRYVFNKSKGPASVQFFLGVLLGEVTTVTHKCYTGDYANTGTFVPVQEPTYSGDQLYFVPVSKDKCSTVAAMVFKNPYTIKEHVIVDKADGKAVTYFYSSFAGLDVIPDDILQFEFDITIA